MSVDQDAPETADRPSTRRGRKRGLIALAIVGALLVPAAAFTIATQPWADDTTSVAAGEGGQGEGGQSTEDAEAELRQCISELDPEAAKDRNIGALLKAAGCLELVDGLLEAYSPLSQQEAERLVEQALEATESAGLQRGQIPGALSKLDETGLVGTFAGDRVAGLISLMAGSEEIKDYASGAIDRDEAVTGIAEVVVASEEKALEEKAAE